MIIQRSIRQLARPISQQASQSVRSTAYRPTCRPFNTSQPRFRPTLRASRTPGYNSLDAKSVQASINKDWKSVKILALAVAGCMVLTSGIIFLSEQQPLNLPPARAIKADAGNSDLPDKFQGKPVVVTAGGAKVLAHDEKTGRDIELIPTGTSHVPHFPKTIQLPAPGAGNAEESEYTLVGLGIRTVSFLGIQVYVVGFYVQTASLHALQAKLIKRVNPIASTLIPGEKEDLKTQLLDADTSYQIWDELLKDPDTQFNSAFRVVPTRGTDFNHLRDGWVRGITSRTQASQAKGEVAFTEESFGNSMREFNQLFRQKGKAPKGSSVILTRDGTGKLALLYQDKQSKPEVFGIVDDERISRLVWLGYLGGKNVSSEEARRKIVDGVIELVERPIGTAAMQVT